MNSYIKQTDYFMKHAFSSEWIPAKYISSDQEYITLLVEDTKNMFFEKNDKIIYSIVLNNKRSSFISVVEDIDFPTQNKIAIKFKKPLERRQFLRFSTNIPSKIYLQDNNIADCTIVDISENGFKILTDVPLPLQSHLKIGLPILNDDYSICICKTAYKHISSEKRNIYGLTIVSLSEEDKVSLSDLIESLG